MLYFIQTTRFIPIDYKQYGFKIIDDNTNIQYASDVKQSAYMF